MSSQSILDALKRIWTVAGSSASVLPAGQHLWHCGRISTSDAIDNHRTLFTTRLESNRLKYAGFAGYASDWTDPPPSAIELVVRRDLIAADFAGASLLEFTRDHCDGRHTLMSLALREWCLCYGFDAIVRLNGADDEVAVATPRASLEIVSTCPL